MKKQLHPHQTKAIDMLRDALRRGKRRPILSLSTGAGKTVIAAQIIENAVNKGKRVLFTVPAIELIDQTVNLLLHEGISDVGVIQACHDMTDPSRLVQVCSVQTLMRRAIPAADLVLIDEAHKLFDFTMGWMADPAWAHVPFIGLTATPYTKGLGKHFDDLLIPVTMRELIDGGFLAPFRVFAPSRPDLSGVKVRAGDYAEDQLSDVMSDPKLVGDAIQHWLEHGQNLPTLVFGVDCAHAKHLQQRFESVGVPCGYMDARTPREERDDIRRRFHNGDLKVVTNVGVLTTGVDWDIRVLVLCRPTKSRILYQQIIGRALRTAPGKPAALIFDHSMTTLNLGFVDQISQSELHDGRERQAKEASAPLAKECPSCHCLKPPRTPECPNCGFVSKHGPKDVKADDGDLVEVTPRKPKLDQEDKAVLYGMLKLYAKRKGYASGWASHKFRERTGVWPNHVKWAAEQEPTPELLNWIRALQIKFAKRRPTGNQASL